MRQEGARPWKKKKLLPRFATGVEEEVIYRW